MHLRSFLLVGAVGLSAGCTGPAAAPSDSAGTDESPSISVSATKLAWESTAMGTPSPKSITIQNFGGSDLDIQGVNVALPFTTTFENLVTLHSGAATTLTVTFTPESIGDFNEQLLILSDDPSHPTVVVTCTGSTIKDSDGDGFDAGSDVGDDCDDTDPTVNPAAKEIWYDGIDENCQCENKRCSDYDQDGDGFDDINDNSDPLNFGGDCNDTNASFYPGAPDAWYDGYDSNCDGANDNDQDMDGYSSSLYTASGSDCDDLDPAINVLGTESYNGKDDNCDDKGYVDHEILGDTAAWIFYGTATSDKLGASLTAGLVDSDFVSEVIAGAPGYGTSNTGAVAIFSGGSFPKTGTDMSGANALLVGAANDALGTDVAYLSDFGSGNGHVVVGASGYSSSRGYAAVLDGESVMAGDSLTDATDLRIEGEAAAAQVGDGLANDLDLDGDGLDEVMGGMRSGSTNELWLFSGDTTSGTVTTSAADARYTITGSDVTMFDSFPGGGDDFDGDGLDDFLFCNDGGGVNSEGEVWVLWGSDSLHTNSSAETLESVASTIATGSSALNLGYICGSAGDWDGDGNAEIWIYDYDDTDFYVVAGDVSLRDGAIDPETDSLALYHFDAATNNPVQLRDLGDLNDSTTHEIGIALSADLPALSSTPGQFWVLGSELGFGEVTTSVEYLSQALFWGDHAGLSANMGASVSGHAADVTGVGGSYRADLVTADPGYDNDSGAVYVFPNYNE